MLVAYEMRLTRTALGSWLEEVRTQQPYPDLVVIGDHRDLVEASIPDLREFPRSVPHDPGCYLFYLDGSEERDTDLDSLMIDDVAERIVGEAERAGRRLSVEVELPSEDYEAEGNRHTEGPDEPTAGESFVLLHDGRAVASVGPGGHVAVEYRNDTVMGTASVRPFVERPQSAGSWVTTDAVIQSFTEFLDSDVEFFPAVGYYEKSWMERQAVLSASLVFLLEWNNSNLYPSRQEILLPATASRDPVTTIQIP